MTVYIVSADTTVRDSLAVRVAAERLAVRALPSLEGWREAAGPEPRGCLVLDAGVNALTGPERLARFASVCARIPVIVLAERGDITTAVHAIRQGAVYVQQKPCPDETLIEYIKQAVAMQGRGSATG
ncbi:MAG TPA: response regulator [Gammaproteobacteria bacterium]|nr:response regulator [Gammaproteobacteria bacterium]